MTTPENQGDKLSQLIEKWGYVAGVIIVSLCLYMYQGDKGNIQDNMIATNARVTVAERAISRLQDGKASREELKTSQEASLRELQGLRQDMKDMMSVMRSDYQSRLDYNNKK